MQINFNPKGLIIVIVVLVSLGVFFVIRQTEKRALSTSDSLRIAVSVMRKQLDTIKVDADSIRSANTQAVERNRVIDAKYKPLRDNEIDSVIIQLKRKINEN